MDELKEKAATKYSDLAKEVKELKEEQIVTNNLLCRLCDLKEAQKHGDIKFRNSWRDAKAHDTRLSLGLLVLANIALYLDIVRIDSDGSTIAFLLSLLKT